MNNFIEEFESIIQKEDFPANPEYSAEKIKKRRIIIYGAGNGLITLSIFVLQRFDIKCETILDRKYAEPELCDGIILCHPDKFVPDTEAMEHALVIISLGDQILKKSVKKQLMGMGFRDIIYADDIYEYHLPAPASTLKQGFNFFKNSAEKIIKAYNLFEDTVSKKIFKQFLFTHLYRRSLPLPCEPLENQYFPLDIWNRSVYNRSVICGAYNGDSAQSLIRNTGNIDALVCFEPDPENFEALKHNIEPYKKNIKQLSLLPLGLYSKNVQLHFSSGNKSNSAVTDDGNLLIQCATLDDCLPDYAPSFISMDIEGSELHALHGMTKIISQNHPCMAICVYHSPEHLWEAPLFLQSLNPDYKFYLKNYTSFTSETVLYASCFKK